MTWHLDILAHLAAQRAVAVEVALQITARDGNGDPAVLRLWTGVLPLTVTIDGQARTYDGAGGVLSIGPERQRHDLTATAWEFEASQIDATAHALLRTHDADLAPVEAHQVVIDPATGLVIGTPRRLFKGRIVETDIPTPPVGGTASARVSCLSSALELTRTVAAYRSDGAHQALHPGCTFRAYVDSSGPLVWMDKTAAQPGAPTAPGGSFGAGDGGGIIGGLT